MTMFSEPLGGFDTDRYVPILLTRAGERLALRELSSDVKKRISPVFTVHPPSLDPDTGIPVSTTDDHVRELVGRLSKDWGTNPAMIDTEHLDPAGRMKDGSHPLAWIVAACADRGLMLSPVVSPSRAADYRAAALQSYKAIASSICLRLPANQWAGLGTPTGDGLLLGFLDAGQISPSDSHLLLDLGSIVGASAELAIAAVRGALRALPHAGEWRSVTVAGSGMPKTTSEIGPDGVVEYPRSEWILWRQLADGDGYRFPSFGDYAVQHPDPWSDFNPKLMDSAAQMRYTLATSWFVARGRGVKAAGTAQARGLAQRVANHSGFAGSGFSWGDAWFQACSNGTVDPGSQIVWRKAATNHHLAFVSTQIATLDVS